MAQIPFYKKALAFIAAFTIQTVVLIPFIRKRLVWKSIAHLAREQNNFYRENPEILQIDQVLKKKLEETRFEDDGLNPFDEWLLYIQVLQHEYEAGNLNAQDVLKLMNGTPAELKREASLKKNERLSQFFNQIQNIMPLEKAGEFYDKRLQELFEKNPGLQNIQNEMEAQLKINTPTPTASQEKQTQKGHENQKLVAEQKAAQDRANQLFLALNPEVAENLSSDVYASQKAKSLQQDKILQKENQVLRKKIIEKNKFEKSIRNIGQEKQKAVEKLKGPHSSIEKSI